MQMEAVSKAAAGSELADALNASQPFPRLPLLPISMPHASATLHFSLPVCADRLASKSVSVVAGGDQAAAVASAIQSRLAAALLHSGGGGPAPADAASAYSFTALVLTKPQSQKEEAATLGVSLDGAGGVAGAAMATLESLGMKLSGSASSALGGVTAVQEQLNSVLGQQGVFPSQLFTSAFGQSK
jgi:hypothetical protein